MTRREKAVEKFLRKPTILSFVDDFEMLPGLIMLPPLERDVAMLLCRACIPFVAQHLECIDKSRACFLGLDYIIHVAAFGGHIRAGELLTVISHQLGLALDRILGLLQLFAEDDVYSSIRAHHGDFRRWPG